MGIPARTQAYGSHTFKENCVSKTTVTKKSGTVTTSQTGWTQHEHTCVRGPYSKNPIQTIAGTSSKFRQPSTYDRGVIQYKNISGAWLDQWDYGTTTASTLIEGPPNSQAALTQFRIPPVFDGTAYVVRDENQQNRADTQALLKLQENKTSWGANTAEAVKAGIDLSRSATPLFRALKALRHGDFRRAWDISKPFRDTGAKYGDYGRAPANAYLALHFGLVPMMKDVAGTYRIFQDTLGPALLVHAHSSVSDGGWVDGSTYNSKFHSTGHASRVHTTKLTARLDDTALRNAAQLGLINPLEVAWEVVPYSFIFDWAIPVGNVLSAMTATVGLSFVGGFRAVWGEGSVHARLLPTGHYDEIAERAVEASYYSARRTKLTQFPAPVLYAKSPFSNSHSITATALALTAVLGK